MSDSQSHDMEQQPIIYQEQQVLWAKIRGYPWWPAFVDKVHGAKTSEAEQIQYTVFFFGDNTHSRLGASKLRRFLNYYAQFFPKAKTNRKLYLSIMKAEQKLKQNGINVQIFQTLRNSLKKSKKGKGHYKTESKISSQDHANNQNSQLPDLFRSKTYPKQQKQQNNSQQNPSIQIERLQPKRRGRKPKKQIQKQEKKQVQKIDVQASQQQKESQNKQLSEQQQQQQVKKSGYRTRSRRGRREVIYKAQQSKEQNKHEQQNSSQSQQSQKQQIEVKNYPLRHTIPKTKQIVRTTAPKKRGRPKKVIQQNENNEQDEQSSESQNNNQNGNNNNVNSLMKDQQQQKKQCKNDSNQPLRRTRNNVNNNLRNLNLNNKDNVKSSTQKPNLQGGKDKKQSDIISENLKKLVLERVRFCLNKRQELIEYLDQLNITIDIIKEILDLDVSIIIQEGEHTHQSIRVLHKLKSALLHKYFPEDIKIKKQFQKMSKKSMLKTSAENQQSLEDLELRKKTIIKLQKILRDVNQTIDHKCKAIQIETFFRKYDQQIGSGYKAMAYRVLRSLKDKNHTIDQVITKLQSGEFEEQTK